VSSEKFLTNKQDEKTMIYGALFAHVTTANVLTAEPTTPARMDPSTTWFTTISGSTLPNHDTAFGTIKYPIEPIVKPIAQKTKIASPLDNPRASKIYGLKSIHY
jgi:hypothetical protein